MILDKYLVIMCKRGRYGGKTLDVRIVQKEPTLKADEVLLRLKIELPTAMFERPKLEAKTSVPIEAVPTIKITSDVTDNIAKIIKETIGLEMAVSVVEHKEEKPNEIQRI